MPLYQISSGNRTANVLATVVRDRKRNRLFAAGCRQSDNAVSPVEGIGMHVVARGTRLTPQTWYRLEAWFWFAELSGVLGSLLMFRFVSGFPGEGTGECFGRSDTCSNELVRDEPTGRFGVIVHRVMQCDPILFSIGLSICTHYVKGMRELRHRLSESSGLFWRWVKLYSYGSVHAESAPYTNSFIKDRSVAFLP